MESFEAAVSEPAVKGARNGSDGVLEEFQTVVERVGIVGCHAHEHVGVAVDVFGDGVHDNVGAVGEGVLDIGGHEGVVDDDEDAVLVGDVGDGADVDEREGRVGRGFDPDEFGPVGLDHAGDVEFDGGRKGDLDAVGRGDFGEVAMRAAVDVGDGNDMASGSETLEDNGSGGGARGKGESVFGLFEGGNGRLKVPSVGVGGARVFVLADGFADRGLRVGGAEGDGLDDCARDRIVRRACVDGESAKLVDGRWGSWRRLDGRMAIDDLVEAWDRHFRRLVCVCICMCVAGGSSLVEDFLFVIVLFFPFFLFFFNFFFVVVFRVGSRRFYGVINTLAGRVQQGSMTSTSIVGDMDQCPMMINDHDVVLYVVTSIVQIHPVRRACRSPVGTTLGGLYRLGTFIYTYLGDNGVLKFK